MKVFDAMTKGVICVPEYATITDAANIMRVNDIGDVCVCNDNKKLVGIITDRDITTKVLTAGIDPNTALVSMFMSTDVATVSPDMSLEDCARFMAKTGVRRLPVAEDAELMGIISLDDMAFCLQSSDLFFNTYRDIARFYRKMSYPSSYLRAA